LTKAGVADGAQKEPIAIVGIGLRLPGANDPESFWRLLRDGVDAITEVPPDRFSLEGIYDPRPGIAGKLCTRMGGFIDQVDQFDPYFFGISPREAKGMDPQQRLLLEVAWEAMEDAGELPRALLGTIAGVFIGMCSSDYGELQMKFGKACDMDIYSSTGSARSIMSGRLSYVLGVEGPSVVVDAACASSLVAVHLACQSIWSGECNAAFAGGVNLILMPEPSMCFSLAGMLAKDGRCKAFDARADGFVRSDGVAVVLLKPLSRAIEDGNNIYAVILGSAVNNDGRGSGLMTPRKEGQEEVLRAAYRSAGISPGKVYYIEAHGTGTSVGDPIEALALGSVLSEGRERGRPCAIGSVKTNIGHTEGTAGVAGLIKVALALKHGAIPPSLHVTKPNSYIPWDELPLVIQTELGPWRTEEGEYAIAGVSSFGISGTNAHVVVAQAPQLPQDAASDDSSTHLLTISAHCSESLEALARAYKEHLVKSKSSGASMRDICYTASARRVHFDHRLAVVSSSLDDAVDKLEAFLVGESRRGMWSGKRGSSKPKVAFVFSPTGSQWVGMGRQLFSCEPVFRRVIEECGSLFREWVDWSLTDELLADETSSRLGEVDVLQPVIFAVEVALAELWRSWGVSPDVVVGHSMGEVAAAHVAGILSLRDAAKIICLRSKIVREKASGKGGMALVELPFADVSAMLKPYEGRLSIAASNGPTTTIISGDNDALREVHANLERRGVFCQLVKVDYASHSPQMDAISGDLIRALEGVSPQSGSCPMLSTVSVSYVEGKECTPQYWVDNIRNPVLFHQAVDRLLKDGYEVFLEISPHPILSVSISQSLRKSERTGVVLPSLRREESEREVMLGSLASLYSMGYEPDWSGLFPNGGRVVRLPFFKWNRERFWLDTGSWELDKAESRRRYYAGEEGGARHPMLGFYVKPATRSDTHIWEIDLGPASFPYLADHRVQGMVVFPGTGYIELALAAAKEVFGEKAHRLEKVSFKKALFLPEDGSKTVQLVVSSEMPGMATFQVFSLQEGGGRQEIEWTLHASGTIRIAGGEAHAPEVYPSPYEIKEACTSFISSNEHYENMLKCQVQYGESFRGVSELWGGESEAIGRLSVPEGVAHEAGSYRIHPALLDAAFQVILGAQFADATPALYMPVEVEKVVLYSRPDPSQPIWSHAVLREGNSPGADSVVGDIRLLDDGGKVLFEVLGLRAQRIERSSPQAGKQNYDEWLYEVRWHIKEHAIGASDSSGGSPRGEEGTWLIFSDAGGVGKAIAGEVAASGDRCILVYPGEGFRRTYRRNGREHYRINPESEEEMRHLAQLIFSGEVPPPKGVIHLWSLDAPPEGSLTAEGLSSLQAYGCHNVLGVVKALIDVGGAKVPRLFLVTRGVQPAGEGHNPPSFVHSPVWGLGRVVALEHPELRCKLVDLPAVSGEDEIQRLAREIFIDDGEDQVALRRNGRYVPRLVRCEEKSPEVTLRLVPGSHPYRLHVPRPGILDHFTLREVPRAVPGEGEVEVEVCAAAINFKDVLIALGLVPPMFEGLLDLGWECSGRVTAVGKGVEGFQVGDEVIAIAPNCFASYVTASSSLVAKKPEWMSFEEAASLPLVFMTAYYALCHQGRLSRGERVLIHAAAGGVGQAAVQIAKLVGAEIFATAGSPEKRDFLRSQGIEHVMNSRSLDFADEVLRATGGKGVHVVLNSLAGEFIPKSLSVLGQGGRFLEIGKVDILKNSQLGMGLFDKNISFFAIDLGELFVDHPELTVKLFREVMDLFASGSLKPLPVEVFPVGEASAAFRHLAQAKHIGKVVLSMRQSEVLVAPSPESENPIREDGSYLITGGLGGLGLTVAKWMAEKGARHLVLMGRRGATPETERAVAELKEAGAQVMIAQADVSREEDVARVLGEVRRTMPPLRGIVHAAAVLDDGIILQLTPERFKTVFAPKVNGAWILHSLTKDDPIDFFVLFSSGASVLASPGQGTYVAANTFLDVLAHHRRALGLPAVSINWGLWGEVGLAARPEITNRLMAQGIMPFTPKQGVELMDIVMRRDFVQVMPICIDWSRMLSFYPKTPPVLTLLAEEVKTSGARRGSEVDAKLREELLSLPEEERAERLEAYLQEQIAKVLGIPASRLDRDKSLMNVGLDSLMALELKNRIEGSLGVELPIANLLKGPSVAELARELLPSLAPSLSVEVDKMAEMLEKLDQLSDEEARMLIEGKGSLLQ
jgi:acyl transferase domain-containing protein/acyl carrier protein